MAEQAQTVFENLPIPYPTEGVIRSAQLNDTVSPENSVQLAINGYFNRIGAFITRFGISTYATALGGAILTFGSLAIQSTGVRRLLAQVANHIFSWDGSSWTDVRTLTSTTNKARYSQYLDLVYTVNGNAASGGDPLQTFNGSVYAATNVGTLPPGDFVQAGFEGRVWVGDKSTDYLYYSDIVSPTGVIGGGLTNYIFKLSSQDGQSMTGLFRVPKALLVFKQNYIIRVYGASSLDPYPAYNVGTYSQESIVQAKDGVYFHHSSGFYKFNYDSQPIEISRRVIDFVQAISRANYENISGIYDGQDNVEWSVGSVTVEGVTYANCVMRYTLSTQVWTIYDIVDENIRAMIKYDDGTNILPLCGTATGKIGRMENGTTDFGKAIYFDLIDRWRSFTEVWSKVKQIVGFAGNCENGAGAELMYQIDKDATNKWESIGTLQEDYTTLFPNIDTKDFNRFRYRLKGQTSGTPIIFSGLEILKLEDKGFNEN